MPDPSRRVIWFCDLDTAVGRLETLGELQGRCGLTTVVPESTVTHTSGFMPSKSLAAAAPFASWRSNPRLKRHRELFGTRETSFPPLPGVVGGFDDTPLLRLIDECRRLGLEVWGHAGLWCYGADLYPEFAAQHLLGADVPDTTIKYGQGFCPTNPDLAGWVRASLAEAARTYELDGFFLDHARYPAPADLFTWWTCACQHCEDAIGAMGLDLEDVRRSLRGASATIRRDMPRWADRRAPVLPELLERHSVLLAWLSTRSRLLANSFASIADAIRAASRRPILVGSDVYPPSIAFLGGHSYSDWARGADFLTGGFGARIGWGTAGPVTRQAVAEAVEGVLGRRVPERMHQLAAELLGWDSPAGDDPADVLCHEVATLAAREIARPTYVPVRGIGDAAQLKRVCDSILAAGFEGAVFPELNSIPREGQSVIRSALRPLD